MISMSDVTLTYPDGAGRVTALDRVDLEARPGTVTAVTGPSGSGKSSLLAVAATLVRPDSGSVVVDGVEVTGLSAARATALRRDRIGIVFQQPNLLASLTVADQLLVMGHLGAGDRAAGARRRDDIRRRTPEVLDAVGMSRFADRRPHQLSGGQRQRVNIARTLVGRPAVLLVDEPTSALDQERGGEIIDLVVRLTREFDTATVLVTHDLSHLDRLDTALRMVDGRLGPLEEAAA